MKHPDLDAEVSLRGISGFHTAAWAKVLRDAYGYRSIWFAAARPAGCLSSLLPVAEVDSWLTGRRGICLPFSDFCQPLARPGESRAALLEEALEYGRRRRWKYLELRDPGLAVPVELASARYFTHRIPLAGSEAEIRSRFSGSTRRAIRKAEQAGLEVRACHDLASLETFHRMLRVNRKKHGVPPQSSRFFEALYRHVLTPGMGTLLMAHHRGEAVAGAIYLHHGKQVIFKYGASDPRFQHLRPNNLITWEAIRSFAASGYEEFHLGRNDRDNPGLRRYKLGWGAVEEDLSYVRYDPVTGLALPAVPTSLALGKSLMRRTPLPLARIIGALAYPHAA